MTRLLRMAGAVLTCSLRHRAHPLRVFYVSPGDINYVTPPSDVVDLTQHSADPQHPHAQLNRGYFREGRIGMVLDGDWDYPRIPFEELLEFRSLRMMIEEGVDWNETSFARRAVDYINAGKSSRGFSRAEDYCNARKDQIQELVRSIRVHGVRRVSQTVLSRQFPDEIGVNVASDGQLLFNNRGHHRLSIAKLVNAPVVPVIVIVRHCAWVKTRGFAIEQAVAPPVPEQLYHLNH